MGTLYRQASWARVNTAKKSKHRRLCFQRWPGRTRVRCDIAGRVPYPPPVRRQVFGVKNNAPGQSESRISGDPQAGEFVRLLRKPSQAAAVPVLFAHRAISLFRWGPHPPSCAAPRSHRSAASFQRCAIDRSADLTSGVAVVLSACKHSMALRRYSSALDIDAPLKVSHQTSVGTHHLFQRPPCESEGVLMRARRQPMRSACDTAAASGLCRAAPDRRAPPASGTRRLSKGPFGALQAHAPRRLRQISASFFHCCDSFSLLGRRSYRLTAGSR
jgi:hypothetical protein